MFLNQRTFGSQLFILSRIKDKKSARWHPIYVRDELNFKTKETEIRQNLTILSDISKIENGFGTHANSLLNLMS